jgi:hypothetical protein
MLDFFILGNFDARRDLKSLYISLLYGGIFTPAWANSPLILLMGLVDTHL